MRPARVDLAIDTGAVFAKGFRLYRETGSPKQAVAVAVGERIYLDERPELVAFVIPESGGVHLRFRQGLWWEPHIWLPNTELVMPAVAQTFIDAQAGWRDIDGRPVALPVVLSDADTLATIHLTDAETSNLTPHEGVWPWDLYVSTVDGGGWQRVAEGSMSIVAGQTFAPVPTPVLIGVNASV